MAWTPYSSRPGRELGHSSACPRLFAWRPELASAVIEAASGGQHQDGHGGAEIAQSTAQLEAGDARQQHIENHQIVGRFAQPLGTGRVRGDTSEFSGTRALAPSWKGSPVVP